MRAYAQLLRHWPLGPLFAAAAVARLPQTMNGLALVLFVYAATGSYGTAGVVAGGIALGMGIGGPFVSRAADRRGHRIVVVATLVHGAMLVSLVVVGAAAPAWSLVGLAVLAGVAFPPVHSILRGRLPQLLAGAPQLLVPAYALDSVLVELTFVSGPLLTGALAALASPSVAVLVAAAASVCGPLAFLRVLPDAAPLEHETETAGWLGPLRSPAIVTVALSMLPFGVALGALEVMLPAFSQTEHAPELAGGLLACWALGSVFGGLAYGARPWRGSTEMRHLTLTAIYPLAFVPMLASSSIATMAVLVVPAGVLISPIFASRNELVGVHAPRGTETEALTWPTTTLLCGLSLGAALSGVLVEYSGWHAAVVLGIGSATASALVVVARRGSLLRPPAR